MPAPAELEDETDSELLDLLVADGEQLQHQQAPKRPAAAVLDSDEEEENLLLPLVRKRQAMLAKDSPEAAAPGAADGEEEQLAFLSEVCMPDAAPGKTAEPPLPTAKNQGKSCTKSLVDTSAEVGVPLALAAGALIPGAAAAKAP
jgi:hypothetical protein